MVGKGTLTGKTLRRSAGSVSSNACVLAVPESEDKGTRRFCVEGGHQRGDPGLFHGEFLYFGFSRMGLVIDFALS